MRRIVSRTISESDSGCRRLALWLIVALAAPGCRSEHKIVFEGNTKPPSVRLIEPQSRNIVRIVGQPSFIESYEHTSIYPKPSAYIQKWSVDIGDKVAKNDVLATLFAPELIEQLGTKKAAVLLDRERVALAKEVVEVAKANVAAAEARLEEAGAILHKYQAEVVRWNTEVDRLTRQVARLVIDPRVLFESKNQLKSSIAALDKAKATIKRAKAELLARGQGSKSPRCKSGSPKPP